MLENICIENNAGLNLKIEAVATAVTSVIVAGTVTAVTVAVKQLVHGTTPGTMSHRQEDTETN